MRRVPCGRMQTYGFLQLPVAIAAAARREPPAPNCPLARCRWVQYFHSMSSGQRLRSGAARALPWFFGFLVVAIGLVNTCWGNDPGFGVFLLLLALVFFPPVAAGIQARTGLSFPAWFRVVLALFILWASLGVGELFYKIELMLRTLRALA